MIWFIFKRDYFEIWSRVCNGVRVEGKRVVRKLL